MFPGPDVRSSLGFELAVRMRACADEENARSLYAFSRESNLGDEKLLAAFCCIESSIDLVSSATLPTCLRTLSMRVLRTWRFLGSSFRFSSGTAFERACRVSA